MKGVDEVKAKEELEKKENQLAPLLEQEGWPEGPGW